MASDPNCIFCKIVEGSIPSAKVYEDDAVVAFKDIQPQAPVHVLVIPRHHVAGVSAVEDKSIFGDVLEGARQVAKKLGLEGDGYRTVFNTGRHACQTVFHLHLHVLGGGQLGGNMVG